MNGKMLYTVAEAASTLGVGRSFLWERLRRGELASISLGRARRIPTDELQRYIARLQADQNESREAPR